MLSHFGHHTLGRHAPKQRWSLGDVVHSAEDALNELADRVDHDVNLRRQWCHTPAMAAGISDHVWSLEEIANLG